MAKINPVKLKQEAEKLERSNRPDEAIALYRQIVDDNPRDWNTVKKIGDLYVRMNRNREAVSAYEKLAEFYANDGFLLKAIAIWKQIQRLDPSALEPCQHLAELYAKQGLMMEAKSQYQTVVDEYIKRGKTRDAGQVLAKMAEVDPGDLKIRSKLADLHLREGDVSKAVAEHLAIADELHKKGHLAEALQVLEKGLKLDPKSQKLRLELARINLLQKNHDRAAQYLEEALQQAPGDPQLLVRLGEAYLGGRKIEEAEAIFKRLLELNPADEDARVQMGRVYLLQNRLDAASDEFGVVAERMLARREGDKAAALFQQIVQRNTGHVKSLVKLVEIYEAQRKEAALVQTYSQLAEAYIQEDRYAEAAEALEVLIAREPQNHQHRSKLDFVRQHVAQGGAGRPAAAAPAATGGDDLDLIEEEFELEEATPSASSRPAPRAAPSAPAAARPVLELSGPLSDEDREFVEEHVAEGRVFRKYGLTDKAADQFEAVIARFPDNVEARQELKEVYKEKGQPDKVAAQCLALAEIHRLRGDATAAAAFEAEANAAQPQAVAPAAPAPPASRAPAPRAAAPQPAPTDLEEEIVLGQEDAPLALSHDEVEIPLEVEEAGIEPATPIEAAAAEGEILSFDLDVEEAPGEELQTQFFDEEPVPAVEELEEAVAQPPEAPAELEPAPAGGGEESFSLSLDEEEEVALEEPAAVPPPLAPKPARPVATRAAEPVAKRPAPSAAPAGGAPGGLQRVLEEVDQYMSLGFVDDAKDALREISGRFPNHPLLLAKVAELGLDVGEGVPEPLSAPDLDEAEPLAGIGLEEPLPIAPEPEPEVEIDFPEPGAEPAPAEASIADDLLAAAPASATVEDLHGLGSPGTGIDLGDELNELFGAQAAVEEEPVASSTDFGDSGLADIFKEFKKGVDKQLGQEDYDTRYNLGIAYKEMGLLDEAIAEFQLAAKDETRLLECASMLGICFLEKGMPKLAIKWFEKGLRVDGRSDEEYQGLRYDLACAYEAAGEAGAALSLYTELYGQDANFRDVAAKVRELRSAGA